MGRARLTSATMVEPGSRKAAPNALSGINPNTPIKLYDTHPNRRFAVGEDVIPVDPAAVNVRGTVLGHVAEDRLLVQWPHEVAQEDVDDVMALRESSWRGLESEVQAMTGSYDRRTSSRQAGQRIAFWDGVDRAAFNFFGNWGQKLDRGVENVGRGIQQVGQGAQNVWNRVNPFSQQNKTKRVQKGIFNQFGGSTGAAQNYNLFSDPQVATFLKRYGLSDKEIQNFAMLRDQQLANIRKKYEQANFLQNGPAKNLPQFGQGGGGRFRVIPRAQSIPMTQTAPGQLDPNLFPAGRSGSRRLRLANKLDLNLWASPVASRQGLMKIHRAANFVDGMLDNPGLANHIRLLARIATLPVSGEGSRRASATKSTARLAMVMADKIRKAHKENPWATKIAMLLEDGVVEATQLHQVA